MLKIIITLVCASLAAAQYFQSAPGAPFRFAPLQPPPPPIYDINTHIGPYRLCTYKDEDYMKCLHTVRVAEKNSIPLALQCVRQDRRDNCLNSVQAGTTDMVVLTGHGYEPARMRNLRPVLFARDDGSRVYIAVAPRNITLVDMQEAPISLDQSDHAAFHAGILFNLQRGHDICAFSKASSGPLIKIVNSANYQASNDEILICPNRLPAEFADYKQCNFEAGLQRAVFVRSSLTLQQTGTIRKIFNTILTRFGPNSPSSDVANGEKFNFFSTFLERDNLIFKNTTIAFDLQPTYRNGVNEKVFDYLHCNKGDHPHDPLVLL